MIVMKTRSLEEARADALSLLKRYLRAPDSARTPILRALAEDLVDARKHFSREDGTPDWKGRSYPYRVFVRDLYSDARVPKDDQAALQAAVRYHVGAVLRERLDPETLEEYGLISKSPKERSADRREDRSALLNALTAKDLHGGALIALSAAYTVLSKLNLEDLDLLDERSAAIAVATLLDVERRAKSLRKRLTDRV